MSLSGRQAEPFLGPFEGKTTAFKVRDRASNLLLARALLGILSRDRRGCTLLDLDAFYSSNIDSLAEGIPPNALQRIDIIVPRLGPEMDGALAAVFREGHEKPLLVDSANTLYQFFAVGSPRAASRKFAFFASVLGQWAESNAKPVFASIYERRLEFHRRASRSLADSFDNSVTFSSVQGGIALKCERGSAWKGGSYFLPFEGRKVDAHEDRDGDEEEGDSKVEVHHA